MSAQFYLSLLNPILALAFSVAAALVWRRWPRQSHFFPLSVAFLYLGLTFITQDWPFVASPDGINYAGNVLSYAAVLLACISTLLRVRARVPVAAFSLITLAALAGFLYFSWIVPSTVARIHLMGVAFAFINLLTLSELVRRDYSGVADRLFVAAVCLGIVLSLGRPVLLLTGGLSLNAEGGVYQSSYWGSIAGLTPLLAIVVATLFIFALVLDIVRELRREADHDLLTGLLNRRGFEAVVADALATSQAGMALLVADIDNFKQVNDSFGHSVGDRVISAVGSALSQHGRADFVGRVGGEEFALFYRQSPGVGLDVLARTISDALAAHAIEGLPRGYPLTVSIGLYAREASEPLSEMQVLADRALYRAKAAGKNRAVAAPARLRSA